MKQRIFFAFLLLSCLHLPAQTCLYLAYEAFDYQAAAPLDGGDGGTGWRAVWTVQNADKAVPGYQVNVGPGSLAFGALRTAGRYASGGRAFLTAGRRLQAAADGPFADYVAPQEDGIGTRAAGDTLWVSLLLRKDENNDEQVFADLHNDGNVPWCVGCAAQHIAVGYFGADSDVSGQRRWTLRLNDDYFPTGVALTPGVPVFAVLRLIFNPGNTGVALFLDPATLGDNEPVLPTLSQNTGTANVIRSIAMYLGNNAGSGAADELRLAARYACVAPDNSVLVNLPPLAHIAAGPAVTGQMPLTVHFDAGGSTDPEGEPLTYTWDFGDGSPEATGQQVSHSYQSVPGSMTASLTVTDVLGLQHTVYQTITALDQNGNIPCQTSFTVLRMAGCHTDDGAIRVNNAPAAMTLHDGAGTPMPATNGNEFHQLAPGIYTFSGTEGLCRDTFRLHIAVDSTSCAGWQAHICDMEIGTNMSGFADWGVERPMRNLFKHVRADPLAYTPDCFCWSSEVADEITFDAEGYPTHVPQSTSAGDNTLVRYVISSESPTGTNLQTGQQYVVLYDGNGAIQIDGPATVSGNTPGRLQFSINTNQANYGLSILSSDAGNRVRNIRLLRLTDESADLLNDPFYPGFLEKIAPFTALRFMDWGATNWDPADAWQDRGKTSWFTYATSGGVPYEIMIQLANQTKKDAWICVPHTADEDYVIQMATLFRDQLDPALTIYLEYSNEVWNWIFPQAHHNENTRPTHLNYGRAYSEKAKNVFRTWHDVFGSARGRVKRVLGMQATYNYLNEQILSQLHPEEWDYAAPTHYFGLEHGNTGVPVLGAGSTVQDVMANAQHSWQGILPALRQDYNQVKLFGKEVITYEGGQHFVGNSFGIPYPYQQALWDAQYSTAMYDMYNQVFDSIRAWGCRLAMNFSLAYPQESVFGSWGVLNDIDVQPPYMVTAPKYQALLDNIPDPGLCAVTSAALPAGPVATVTVYPNPAGAGVQVAIAGTVASNLRIYITDNAGRVVMVKEADTADNAAGFTLDTSALPDGLYFIHTHDRGIPAARFVVIR